jgi:hypothetical protein
VRPTDAAARYLTARARSWAGGIRDRRSARPHGARRRSVQTIRSNSLRRNTFSRTSPRQPLDCILGRRLDTNVVIAAPSQLRLDASQSSEIGKDP